MKSRFENVLFDLDGTLVDSKGGVIDSLLYSIAALGVEPPIPAEMDWCVGPPLRSIFQRLLKTTEPEIIERAYVTYVDRYARKGLLETRVFAGVPEMLERLDQSDVRLFVVTAKLTLIAHRVLKMCDLDSFFDSVIGAEPDGRFEEKPSSIRMILRRESLSAASTAMVGDREHDVIGARHNGVFSVGVEYGYGSRAELEAAGVNAICANPAAVADFLLSSPKTRQAAG